MLIASLQTSKATTEIGALQKGADFVKAYALGFDVNVSADC
jgi:RNA-binding protein PNO1